MGTIDRWAVRLIAGAVIVLTVYVLGGWAVDFALWRRDITASVIHLRQQAGPPPRPPAPRGPIAPVPGPEKGR